jgi:hypothetical protein
MLDRVHKATWLAIAFVLVGSGAAFAGENANAVVTLTSPVEVSGVGPGAEVTVALSASGLVGAKQIAWTVEVSDPSHFDFGVYTAEGADPANYITPPPGAFGAQFTGPEYPEGEDDQLRVAFAYLQGDGLTGESTLGELKLVTSSSFTATTEVTITVVQVTLGQSSEDRDAFDAEALDLSITVNPPVSEPALTATTPTDASLSYGESVAFGVAFTDRTGAAASGQTISWTIVNNGSESVFVLGQEIGAGSTVSVNLATDSNGSSGGVISSEGDRTAGTTSISVTAATSADNSEGVSRDLSVTFSATWDVPVAAELSSFAADVTLTNEVILRWGVVSQSNNLGWEIYRSLDNIHFEQVGDLVPGDGTTDVFKVYTFEDADLPAVQVLYYYLRQIDLDGSTTRSRVLEVQVAATAASSPALPWTNALHQNFPNPFNPETTIAFDLSEEAVVNLTIYDMAGQVVRELAAGKVMAAGHYKSLWDGRDNSGNRVGSGLYFYRLGADDFTSVKKMILLK